MDSDPIYWLPDSPWSSPAHRWLQGRWLHGAGKQVEPHLDEGVRRVQMFLHSGGNAEAGADSERADPVLTEAFKLYDDGPTTHKWRLEAYLLTDEPMEVVAERCLIRPDTAQVYHDTFFDVRAHRQAHDWLWTQAIRAGAWNGFRVDYPGSLWKGVAHTAGSLALEITIAVTTDIPFPEWVQRSFDRNPPYEEARLRLLGKLTVASLRAKTLAELAPLVDAREQLRALDRQVLGSIEETAGVLPAMEGFLKSLGRRKGRQQRPGGKPSQARKLTAVPENREKVGWRETVDALLAALK